MKKIAFIVFSVCLVMAGAALTNTKSVSAATPTGWIDDANADHVWGWAYDADAPSSPVSVSIYVDGVFIGIATANASKPDLVTNAATADPYHGFDYFFSTFPNRTLPAGNHSVEVYAGNLPTGASPTTVSLQGSPKAVSASSYGGTTAVCGNGVVEGDEQCDYSSAPPIGTSNSVILSPNSCQTLTDGLSNGAPVCTSSCTIDTSGCFAPVMEINLKIGWNFVSFVGEPVDSNVDAIFSSIAGKFSRVTSFVAGGAVAYNPLTPTVNTLKAIHAGQAFQILMTQDAILLVSARMRSTLGTFPTLTTNAWNEVGPTGGWDPISVSSVLGNMAATSIIYTFAPGTTDLSLEANKLYYPTNFTSFEAYKGYWVKPIPAPTTSGGTTTPICGNGIAESGEQCDGTQLANSPTCAIAKGTGYTGTVSCTANCTIDTTKCVTPVTNIAPKGWLEEANTTHVKGWAVDLDAPTTPLKIGIYVDGKLHSMATADNPRPDLATNGAVPVAEAGALPTTNHGFDFTFTALTAGAHVVTVQAQNLPSGLSATLDGSPKTIGITDATTTCPTGYTKDSAGNCTAPTVAVVPTCGNGVLNAGEECDYKKYPAIPYGTTCATKMANTAAIGTLTCGTDCKINTAQCTIPVLLNVDCISAAVEKRETALIAAFDVYTPAMKEIINTRKNALKAAWAVTDRIQRKAAIKAAWTSFNATKSTTIAALKKAKTAAWATYAAERKTCGTYSYYDDTTSSYVDMYW